MKFILKAFGGLFLAVVALTANAQKATPPQRHLASQVLLNEEFEEEGVVLHHLIPKRGRGPWLLVAVSRPDGFGFTDEILEKVLDVLSTNFRSGLSEDQSSLRAKKFPEPTRNTVMCSLEVQALGKNGLIGQGVEIQCGTFRTFESGKGRIALRTVSTLSHDDFEAQILKIGVMVKETYADALLLSKQQKR